MTNRIGLFVKEDIPFPVTVGQTYNLAWSRYRIVDMNYTNQYGTFILGCCVEDHDDSETDDWVREMGRPSHPDNPIELLKTLYIEGGLSTKGLMVAFLYRDRQKGKIFGLTYREIWPLVFHHGAVNAGASRSRYQQFNSRLLDTIDELRGLDSWFWRERIEYRSKGEEIWSSQLQREIERRGTAQSPRRARAH
ncbi:hypothetical protein [Alicyclobacillus sp. SO9]|uniref:hypothetical protein n=1 Tax=Alicyclobacillus sp. SO9 TaxID=2665646 RepID=UPI0018E8B8B8|nr:hypothetical protein [Alicyclobacillus sp. SO9]QQE80460.1 hypothetical protein GI364_08630 [Alicyclobacillus sp. SO9]